MEKISKIKKCKFYLATGKNSDEQIILNEILQSKFKDTCLPLDDLSIKEISVSYTHLTLPTICSV